MPKPPENEDWTAQLESLLLVNPGHSKDEIERLIHGCQALLEQMQPAIVWVDEQRRAVNDAYVGYQTLYRGRFRQEPPPRRADERVTEIRLDTPESRRQTIRDTALALAKPGEEITDKQVLDALKAQGQRIVAANPTATISTILNGFGTHFEKVKDKRGVFKRRAAALPCMRARASYPR
jgi:hypothetical protein